MATDVQNAWVTRVLGLDSALATAKPNPDAVARLTAAIRQLEALKAEGAPELPALFAAVTAARAAIATPEAGAQLNALEAAIARAQSAARGRAAKTANSRGISWPKLLLRWRGAQSQAVAAVSQIGETILAIPEVRADPRFDKARAAVTMLPMLIPDFGDTLADLLDKGLGAGTDSGIANEALALVTTYRQQLAGAVGLGRLERFAKNHAGGIAVLTALDGALAEIATSLESAA